MAKRNRSMADISVDPFMTAEEFLRYIKYRNACVPARNWVKRLIRSGKAKTGEDVWLQVPYTDWLEWLVYEPSFVRNGPITTRTLYNVAHHMEITLREYMRQSCTPEVAAFGNAPCVLPENGPRTKKQKDKRTKAISALNTASLHCGGDDLEVLETLTRNIMQAGNPITVIPLCHFFDERVLTELNIRLCEDIRHCISFEDMLLQYAAWTEWLEVE